MYLNSSTSNHGCTAILMVRITDNERGTETAVASLHYHLHTQVGMDDTGKKQITAAISAVIV